METLIPVVNKLQEVFSTLNSEPIDLPQIAVVGSQSSGKSSVLEAFVGRDFLPRGTGIVTRCPLVLQLINLPWTDKSRHPGEDTEWGEFSHLPNKQFRDFTEIRKEIDNRTAEIAGSSKGISDTAIYLKIRSPFVLNLTLVDLPGITKVPVGDQPTDIEKQITRMILKFIANPKCIILAVTSANTDIANSDALSLAKTVDADGMRTIGVLTKVDLMDKGTDALEVLLGKVVPLQLGFIGVVNRSQCDINNNKSIRAAQKSEREFFSTHSAYRNIASRCGTHYLASTLSKLLMHHIRSCLPEVRDKVNRMTLETQTELSSYASPFFESESGKGALLLQILTKYSSDFRDAIDGRNPDLSTKELQGGARLNYIFNELFFKRVAKISAFEGLCTNDIRTAVKNATGPKPCIFVPEVAFELLAKRQIALLKEPSLQCAELALEELLRLSQNTNTPELRQFTNLREKLHEVTGALLHSRLKPTSEMISNIILMEMTYFNTNHPDFTGGSRAIADAMEKLAVEAMAEMQQQQQGEKKTKLIKQTSPAKSSIFQSLFGFKAPNKEEEPPTPQADNMDKVPTILHAPETLSGNETVEVSLIRTLLDSYFAIVKKNVQDAIPKCIMLFLVTHLKENLQHSLLSELYKDNLFDTLMAEDPAVVARRKLCKETLKTLKRASAILSEVRESSFAPVN